MKRRPICGFSLPPNSGIHSTGGQARSGAAVGVAHPTSNDLRGWDATIDHAALGCGCRGGGAGGVGGGVCAAERGRGTLLLEKNRRPGCKILMSGGTRCNLTHAADRQGIVRELGPAGAVVLHKSRRRHARLRAFPRSGYSARHICRAGGGQVDSLFPRCPITGVSKGGGFSPLGLGCYKPPLSRC